MFRTLFALTIALTAPALPQSSQPTAVPDNLQVPSGHVAFLQASATGTQNYVCLPSPNGLAWKFQGPQATLFLKFRFLGTEVQQQVTTHYLSANPTEPGTPARATWQSSLDTSTVWAKKIQESSDPAYVAPNAIPWLLLEVTGSRPGPMGGSALGMASYIQRIRTTGGVTPTTACTEPGAIAFVPYTTDYIFFRPTGRP